jgi:transcriptional regulator with PAS, ATPase and Fis domain
MAKKSSQSRKARVKQPKQSQAAPPMAAFQPIKLDSDAKELIQHLRLVALGCNDDCHTRLKHLFRAADIYVWSLNEYLLTRPIGRESDSDHYVLALFLERDFNRLPFIPNLPTTLSRIPIDVVKNPPLVPNTGAIHQEYLDKLSDEENLATTIQEATIGYSLYRRWRNNVDAAKTTYCRFTATPTFLRPTSEQQQINSLKFLMEFYLTDFFWSHGKTDHEPVSDTLAIPIASDSYFYGYLVITCPPKQLVKDDGNFLSDPGKTDDHITQESDFQNDSRLTDLGKKLCESLGDYSKRRYLPIVTLCHHRLAELRLKRELETLQKTKHNIEDVKKAINKNCFLRISSRTTPATKPTGNIEAILNWLWGERLSWLDHSSDTMPACEAAKVIRDNLLFAEYGIASEAMLDVTTAVMNVPFKYDKSSLRNRLDSVLVVGGPGSGKDNLARFVVLFSENYTFGDVYTYNVAAIRPQTLVGPALQGFEPVTATGSWKFESILPRQKDHDGTDRGHSKYGRTVILDELNSIDIDQQGVLLRILENAEVTPLFSPSHKPYKVDFLCIGVMNENPSLLMKEEENRAVFTQSPVFGKIFGTAVDEFFRGARRLRPDLYYRMTRLGVFSVPNLSERRADIPLLFFVSLPDNKTIKYFVELGVYHELMRESLPWKGNIRELQAVAAAIAREARDSKPATSSDDNSEVAGKLLTVRIRTEHAEKVLKDLYPEYVNRNLPVS